MSTILKLDRILHHFEEIAHQITEYRHTMFVRFDMCAFSMNYDAESNLVYHESIHITYLISHIISKVLEIYVSKFLKYMFFCFTNFA